MYFYNTVLQSCIFPVYIFIRSIKSQYIAPSLALQKTYTKKELFSIRTCIFCSQKIENAQIQSVFCLLKLTVQCYSVFWSQL